MSSSMYISITIHADNGRRGQFERMVPRQVPTVAATSGVRSHTNDDEVSRRLMEVYQEAQDWLAAGKPRRPIQDSPQA